MTTKTLEFMSGKRPAFRLPVRKIKMKKTPKKSEEGKDCDPTITLEKNEVTKPPLPKKLGNAAVT
jgi:hypothetical protein